jgi:hypothetical protein
MKQTIPMATIYEAVAGIFRSEGEREPTRCDVRCTVNDTLDAYDKDGFRVHFGYSQERAYHAVRAILNT